MQRYSQLSRLADRNGFAVIYPQAGGNFWRIGAGEDGADVQFLDALLDDAQSGGCFDARRVSAVGVSNGAGMVARLACSGDDRLAGVVAVAGGYGTLPDCRARRPVSVLEIHGTADPVVPYLGTPQYPKGNVLRWIGGFVALDKCPQRPERTSRGSQVVRLDWGPCREGTRVAHLRLIGGQHAWPGADPPDPGPRIGVSASAEAWAFLRDQRLAGSPPGDPEG
jgi:polyhydroxybutyrate depolymerase